MNYQAPKSDTKLSLWRKLSRYEIRKNKLSTKNLDRLCREYATEKKILVIHSEDVNYKPYFPNAFTVTKRKNFPADLHVDPYYKDIRKIESEGYEVILCSGLLEHIPDPQRLIDECHRILMPGGRLIISASAVFSFHEGPDDFFHFTPFSFQMLFKNWTRIEMLRGASQPFETIAILIQRITKQCDIFPPVRAFLELFVGIIPFFDRFIITQYDHVGKKTNDRRIDSMLPSNIQAVVVK
jgi:SAM-dependent methyltransferase